MKGIKLFLETAKWWEGLILWTNFSNFKSDPFIGKKYEIGQTFNRIKQILVLKCANIVQKLQNLIRCDKICFCFQQFQSYS